MSKVEGLTFVIGPMTDALQVRPARPEDVQIIARLMGVLGYPTSPRDRRERLEAILRHPDYRTVVAEFGGQIRGAVGLRRDLTYEIDGPIVCVMAIVVDEVYQGLGVGAALMQQTETWATELGATAVRLTNGMKRPAAHRFYENRGSDANGLRFVKKLKA